MPAPLHGIRIVDVSTIVSGPMATQMLADQGAEVIKIEAPGLGDLSRYLGPMRGGISAMFININRNKKSVALNLKHADGKKILLDLVRSADAFVENMRPEAIKRLGLGFEDLTKINPTLVYLSMSGFGDEGPYSARRVYDPVIQAVSGFAYSQADRDTREPRLIQSIVCDKVTALTAAQALTAGLLARARGQGAQLISLNMLDSTLAFLWPDAFYNQTFVGEGASVAPDFSDIYSIKKTKDGFITTTALSDEEFAGLVRAVGAPELLADPRFKTLGDRIGNGRLLSNEIGLRLEKFTTAEAVARLDAEDVAYAAANTRAQVLDDPQVAANKSLTVSNHPSAGAVRQARAPAVFRTSAPSNVRLAPSLGEDTDGILAGLGRTPDEIKRLRDSGAVA
jgi:crotonobetainyl-CoA:carnitine CoA-transferase CaiB-like acyl-CoA transferase